MKLENYLDYLVDWLKKEVKKANAKGLIVGVSGGIDSAVVANLIKKAFPNNSLGVMIPCNSPVFDLECGQEVIENSGIDAITVDITSTFKELTKQMDVTNKLALANTKARLRMTTLYALAQQHGYLVVGTDNACEWHTGYFTKYGDGGVDLVPLKHLVKGEVKKAAKILNVPKKVIDREPTASLLDGQTDEKEMQVTYKELDAYLKGEKVSLRAQERIEFLHKVSNHKRKLAPSPKKFIEKK